MKVHHCKSRFDIDHLAGQKLTADHYDYVLGGDEACDVYKPDGSPLVKYRPNWFSPELCKSVLPACRKAARPTVNRGFAAGGIMDENGKVKTTRQRMRKTDGTISNTTVTVSDPVLSGIIGYFDRNSRFPFCRQTSFVIQEAAAWKQ